MIGQKTDALDIQVTQDLSADSIFAVILPLALWSRSTILVGMELDRIRAVDVSNSKPVRVPMKVDDNSGTFLGDSSQGALKIEGTTTGRSVQYATGKAVIVYAHHNRIFRAIDMAQHQRYMRFGIEIGAIGDRGKITERRWN